MKESNESTNSKPKWGKQKAFWIEFVTNNMSREWNLGQRDFYILYLIWFVFFCACLYQNQKIASVPNEMAINWRKYTQTTMNIPAKAKRKKQENLIMVLWNSRLNMVSYWFYVASLMKISSFFAILTKKSSLLDKNSSQDITHYI